LVTQNWTQAVPSLSLPFHPFSTLSMENLAVCGCVSQTNALRWLCHHADAALDEPSLGGP
jgi:hypothetical protein